MASDRIVIEASDSGLVKWPYNDTFVVVSASDIVDAYSVSRRIGFTSTFRKRKIAIAIAIIIASLLVILNELYQLWTINWGLVFAISYFCHFTLESIFKTELFLKIILVNKCYYLVPVKSGNDIRLAINKIFEAKRMSKWVNNTGVILH